jgi:esterase/lipase superfamily enzyme
VHLMAQSMGNYVLRCALQTILKKPEFNPIPRPIFDQIFLCSADEDMDSLRRPEKLQPLPEIANRITVYTNKNDRALLVSATTKHLAGRLGREGPDRDPDLLKLSLVNVTGVLLEEKNDFPHHYYNRLNPVVQKDILYCMSGSELDEIPVRQIVTQPRQFKLLRP